MKNILEKINENLEIFQFIFVYIYKIKSFLKKAIQFINYFSQKMYSF